MKVISWRGFMVISMSTFLTPFSLRVLKNEWNFTKHIFGGHSLSQKSPPHEHLHTSNLPLLFPSMYGFKGVCSTFIPIKMAKIIFMTFFMAVFLIYRVIKRDIHNPHCKNHWLKLASLNRFCSGNVCKWVYMWVNKHRI